MRFYENISHYSGPNLKPLISNDGKYLVLGVEDHGNAAADSAVMLKVDLNGDLIWSKTLQLNDNWKPSGAIKAPDGNIVIFGTANLEPNTNIQYFAKMDEECNIIWQDSMIKKGISTSIAVAPDGGYIIAGGTLLNFLQGYKSLIKIDDFGNVEWFKNFQPFDDYAIFMDIKSSHDGVYITLEWEPFTNYYAIRKLDEDGNNIWTSTTLFGGSNQLQDVAAVRIEVLPDGSIVTVGLINIYKFDPDGNQLWSRPAYDPQLSFPDYPIQSTDFARNSNGDFFVLRGNSFGQARVDKFDEEGQWQWTKKYGLTSFLSRNIVVDPAGSLIITANNYESAFTDGDLVIIKTDSLGVLFSSALAGTVHHDTEADCLPDPAEEGLGGWLVQTDGAFPYFTTTDSNGHFLLPVDTGTYNVTIIPKGQYWVTCNSPYQVSVTEFYDTLSLDFPAQAAVDCPYLTVDISAPFLRRCFDNYYHVHYCNEGTMPAEDATVEVTLDPYFTYISSSIPLASQNGNTLTFNLGDVGIGDCGSFHITAYLDCDSTVLGQAHCTTAHISPDSLCFQPSPLWDGSSIETDVTCNGDSVIFTITNVGTGTMSAPLGYIIIEDQIVLLSEEFQLLPGQSTTVTLPANGSTLHLEAQQSAGHPSGFASTGATIEGCGGWMSIGLFTQWAFDDDPDPFTDVDCQANIGSFDPNDKQGFPAGVGEEHLIEPGQDLEYLIRFQNTGTDTAFKVVIVDVLPPELDLASIRPGASSHPYTYGVTPEGWLTFTFEDIMLPDSNVNEPASHGFVRFRASQVPGLGHGNVIANTALIYFDFNAPIQTNTYRHKIGQLNPWTVVGTEPPVFRPKTNVNVVPNPLTDSAVLQVEGIEPGTLNLVLTDVSGKVLRQQAAQGTSFEFQRGELAPGVYFFQIARNGERVASGKLMVK
jgi:uncharacterized repeat protein (TIGR01451 family)